MINSKEQIRKEIFKKRSSLDINDVIKKSNLIIERLIKLDKFKDSKSVMCYVDFRNEVITRDLIRISLDINKRVAVPFICDLSQDRKQIVACEINNIDNDLEVGSYNILEPKNALERIISPEEIDIVILPGVAFDTHMNRIGYGAGFYDRFLPNLKKSCFKVGLAFEIQVVEQIPFEQHDVLIDCIITESRLIGLKK